jgi:hypothetical protein
MRVIGAVFLIVGVVWSAALGESLGLLPVSLGMLLLLTSKARGVAAVRAGRVNRSPPPRRRQEFLEPAPENLSPEVKELFERLTRKRVDGERP